MAQGVQGKLNGKVRDYPLAETSPHRYSSFNYARKWRKKDTKNERHRHVLQILRKSRKTKILYK